MREREDPKVARRKRLEARKGIKKEESEKKEAKDFGPDSSIDSTTVMGVVFWIVVGSVFLFLALFLAVFLVSAINEYTTAFRGMEMEDWLAILAVITVFVLIVIFRGKLLVEFFSP